jgi:alpha-galactosidase
VEDYNAPEGYQMVLRQLGEEALLIVHTFYNGANPPVDSILKEWNIIKEFGSSLDGDFRAKAYILNK